MEQFGLMAAANGQGGGGAPFKPKTLSGVPYDECISGLQKMIRRGKEKEALILMQELCSSGYPSAVARRLMIIAPEDIGIANPALVAQVTTLCMGYLYLNEKRDKGRPPIEPIALYMATILLCRSPKNRETDNAQIVFGCGFNNDKYSAKKVLEDNPAIADRHTDRGKQRLRNLSVARGTTYEYEAWREFLTEGTLLYPHEVEGGNIYAREMEGMFDYFDFDRDARGFDPAEELSRGLIAEPVNQQVAPQEVKTEAKE